MSDSKIVLLPLKAPDDRSAFAAGLAEVEEDGRDLSDAELYALVNQALAEEGMEPYPTVLEMLAGIKDHYRYAHDRTMQILNSRGWDVTKPITQGGE